MSKLTEQEELRKIQMVQLEMLKEFDRICKKHQINYQLFAGTLLGAVRHKGFIPWDDDIDLCLIRDEYNKFIDVCKREMDSDYFLQTYQTDKAYYKQSARIRKNHTLMLQDLYSGLDIHHGICISVMPLDHVKPGSIIGKCHRITYDFLLRMFAKVNDTRSLLSCKQRSGIKRYIKLSMHYLVLTIPKALTDALHTKIASIFNNKETEYITHLTNGSTKKRYYAYMTKKSDFYDTIEGEFEGHMFPIPRHYDKVLTNLYGDYLKLPPKNEQIPHHGVKKISFHTETKRGINLN